MADPPTARLREVAALAEAAARRRTDDELAPYADDIADALDAMQAMAGDLTRPTPKETTRV